MAEIIAEIGKNFVDDTLLPEIQADIVLFKAKRLIQLAKKAGADTVKFQTHVLKDEEQKRHPARWKWIHLNEVLTPPFFWEEIKKYCDFLQVNFLTTPMSRLAAEKVNHLVNRWKVSSADIVDMELLRYLKKTKKPIILSTGMSSRGQVKKAVKFLGNQIDFINYCVSLYPCPIWKIDLSQLLELKKIYPKVGFSDHSLSVEAPALAARMGAVAIEKHFTFSRNDFGPDHATSLEPEEFKKMVFLVRQAEKNPESFLDEQKYWEFFRYDHLLSSHQ